MKNFAERLSLVALTCVSFSILAWNATPAQAWDRGNAEIFAVLPDGATGPEGLAVGPDGKVYVTTFGFNAGGPASGPGQLYVFNKNGTLAWQVSIAGSSPHPLGLAFHPTTGVLLVLDFGAGVVRSVNPSTGSSSVFMTVTGSSGLNALTFDQAGNVYVSDSFQGIIWKTGAAGGAATAWVTDPLLATAGVPPFGANGLGFNKAGDTLFVANTGNDTIVKIPVSGGIPGAPAVFVNSINGADGIVLDRHDNIWVAANQADEIVVLDPTGKVIAKLGDFDGITKDGVPRGLLFPASPDFSKDGHTLYVSNLALDLRLSASCKRSMDRQGQALHNLQNQGEYTAAFPRLTFVHQSPASSATEDAGLKPHDLGDLMGWPTSIPSRQCSAGMTVLTEKPMTMHLI